MKSMDIVILRILLIMIMEQTDCMSKQGRLSRPFISAPISLYGGLFHHHYLLLIDNNIYSDHNRNSLLVPIIIIPFSIFGHITLLVSITPTKSLVNIHSFVKKYFAPRMLRIASLLHNR